MNNADYQTLSISLPEELVKQIDEKAKEKSSTRDNLINDILHWYLIHN